MSTTAQPAAGARWLGALCVVAVLVIWTSFILIARASAAHTLSPLDIAWLRFCVSGLVVLPFAVWRWRWLRAQFGGGRGRNSAALARALMLALTAGLGYCTLAYSGFFFAPAAHAAVLMPGSLPLWSALLALWLLGERLTPGRAAGLALIVLGDLLVGGAALADAFDGHGTWRGDLLFLAAGATWALYGVLCRRWRVGAVEATLAIGAGTFATAVPAYVVAMLAGWVPSGLGAAPWAEIAFQGLFQGGVAMLAAGLAFTQVVALYGPVRATLATALVPALAALAAVPLLGETLGAAAVAGLACVTLGLLLGTGVIGPRAAARAAA